MIPTAFVPVSGAVGLFALIALAAPLRPHSAGLAWTELGLLLLASPVTASASLRAHECRERECRVQVRACQAQQNAWQYSVVLVIAHALAITAVILQFLGIMTRATALTMVGSLGWIIVLVFPAAMAAYPRIPRLPPPAPVV